jgi:hypothetical protein
VRIAEPISTGKETATPKAVPNRLWLSKITICVIRIGVIRNSLKPLIEHLVGRRLMRMLSQGQDRYLPFDNIDMKQSEIFLSLQSLPTKV